MTEPLVVENGVVSVLDQRLLPLVKRYVRIGGAADGVKAIRDMAVRGAPLIGVTAFYALAAEAGSSKRPGVSALRRWAGKMAAARPTAVNLAFAVGEFTRLLDDLGSSPMFPEIAFEAAADFHRREALATARISRNGASLFRKKCRVMTHCNAGALATTGHGTALGVIAAAHARGRIAEVFACETRPYLQGMRLTAFELEEAGIPHRVVCDNTAGFLMSRGMVDAVVVGADRIAANGDTANKIGTFTLAVLCRHHDIPFYVAAPLSTIDFSLADGGAIPIEERHQSEMFSLLKKGCAPGGLECLYYAFDVTPARLVTAVITEAGVVSPVTRASMKALILKT